MSVAFSHLLGGQVYDYAQVRAWLEQAGFRDPQRKNILKAGSALIHAPA